MVAVFDRYGNWVEPPPKVTAAACAADPELAPHLLALASLESGFDPNAVANTACPNKPYFRGYATPGEYSLGLLQLNTCGGLGGSACCNISPEEEARLFDPVTNMAIGAQAIRARLAQGASLYDALSPWYNARNILARNGWFNQTPENPCGAGTPVNGGGTTAPSANPLPAILLLLLLYYLLG